MAEIPPGPNEWTDGQTSGQRVDPAERVGPPAVSLILVAVLGLLVNCSFVVVNFANHRNEPLRAPPTNMTQAEKDAFRRGQKSAPFIDVCCIGLPTVAVYGLILAGALSMQRLHSRGLAMTAAILAMLPCGPAILVGLPVGIWALVVLSNRDVALAFQPDSRRNQPDGW
jgi:hypothetical protein